MEKSFFTSANMLSYYHLDICLRTRGHIVQSGRNLYWLALLMACLLLTCGALSATASEANDKVAMENDVLHFSYELESWLDASKSPCEDFFGYVCARSLNVTPQARHERRLQQEQAKFGKFMEASDDEQLLDSELKLKQFQDSCQNARGLDQLKSSPMYRLSGGWPAADDAVAMSRKRRNMTWLQVLSVFHEAGIPFFFNAQIELQSNKRVVHIQPHDVLRFTLRKFEQLSGEIMQAYNVDTGRARLVALEILNFERNARDIMKLPIAEEDRRKEYSYESFKGLNFGSVAPLDWDSYFRKIMGKPLKNTDLVIVEDLPKLINYFELLQSTTMTRFLNWLWIVYLIDKTPHDCQALTKKYFSPVYEHIVERSAINKVQMAQMYSELGQAYEQYLTPTPWIDEITVQNSKLFLSNIMHLTLNGDAKLDAEYESLAITKRNFYRNLEKVQRFDSQRLQVDRRPALTAVQLSSKVFMESFLIINNLIQQQQNLSAPLNYVLVGQNFAEVMIGGAYKVPGAWRSMDSERQFGAFTRCLDRQQPQRNYNVNDLILRLLAQYQSWQTYKQWLQREELFTRKLDRLLGSGRLQLSMEKLYFVASTLSECQLYGQAERKEFTNAYIKQSKEFQQAFKCQPRDALFLLNKCSVNAKTQ